MRQAWSAVVGQISGSRETGRTQIERALPVGTPLTAIGELAFVSEALGACTGAVRHAGQVGFNTHVVCHGAEGLVRGRSSTTKMNGLGGAVSGF